MIAIFLMVLFVGVGIFSLIVSTVEGVERFGKIAGIFSILVGLTIGLLSIIG